MPDVLAAVRWAIALGLSAGLVVRQASAATATLEPRAHVRSGDVASVEVRPVGGRWQSSAWDDLERTSLAPGLYELRVRVDGRDIADGTGTTAIEVPWCAGRAHVVLDGHDVGAAPGPVVVPLGGGHHEIAIVVTVSPYEQRIACGEHPRLGEAIRTIEGLGVLSFQSVNTGAGGGRAVVYVPPGHDLNKASPLLVGAHPWNGSVWTYAAYAPLLREARARDVILLMPSALGNSLYTAPAEEEVLRALDALSSVVAVDPAAVSIWGASMGGAGATTIAFHHPDRFAGVTSFFGDSKYDLGTYVRGILPSESAAHLVNALDIVDNARSLPVWLVHGESDRTSPIRQSEMLDRALRKRGFSVRFDRVPEAGHSGVLVTRFLSEVVDVAAVARAPVFPRHVTYRSVRPTDTGAYGVSLLRPPSGGDAFVDIERSGDVVHIRHAEGIRGVRLARGALDTNRLEPPPIVDDTRSVSAQWDSLP